VEPLSRELIAQAMARVRELHERDVRPDEGLRERKKRLTRQHISDTATWMFCARGFDHVRVAEVAAEAGVSEKTVFNYFPTKESLVLDREDELVAGLREALTDRGPGVSPTQAMVAFIERQCAEFDRVDEELRPLFFAFARMLDDTPALRTAQQELSSRFVAVAREALAESIGVDPRDPEPFVAAQSLVTLWEVFAGSRRRQILDGVPIGQHAAAVLSDVRRAARLLETGLWSFNSIAQGSTDRPQLAEAAKAANEARKQVVEALRQARAAWAEARRLHEAGGARRAGRHPED
jgi:AcrR family transcriptional regulator